MLKSEQINELAAALAKAQGQLEGAKKSSSNPFFKSKYADLAECWNTCREALTANEISVIQMPEEINENGRLNITTMLAHSSGQYISSTLTMTVTKLDPQAIGSAITYGRRYALAAMVGLAQEDDDGEKAMARQEKKDKNPVESPINITSVSENGAVRFINGVQCQIQDKNGDWHDVEFLKIEVLEKLLNDDKYVNAHEAIRAAINAKAVEVK
ncbi:ERF family protein [Phascolarctobacterium faecium]|uniref:ERF family protein n=1 Tax=Phascolarctobacterium faecium TaxID=33025 RepID=UPI00242EB5E3|nr:ERF family protein [Phascolarctobacterium faecium]